MHLRFASSAPQAKRYGVGSLGDQVQMKSLGVHKMEGHSAAIVVHLLRRFIVCGYASFCTPYHRRRLGDCFDAQPARLAFVSFTE